MQAFNRFKVVIHGKTVAGFFRFTGYRIVNITLMSDGDLLIELEPI